MASDEGDSDEVMQSVRSSGEKDRRRTSRIKTEGHVLWSYASNPIFPENEGELIDINKLGIGFISDKPIKEGSVVRVKAKGLWQGYRYATVMLCNKVDDKTFSNGVIFN